MQNDAVYCLRELVLPLVWCFLFAANADNMKLRAKIADFPNAFDRMDAFLAFI
jgi:hypothetical protein